MHHQMCADYHMHIHALHACTIKGTSIYMTKVRFLAVHIFDFASLFQLIFTLSKIDQIIICLKKKYNLIVEKKLKIKI